MNTRTRLSVGGLLAAVMGFGCAASCARETTATPSAPPPGYSGPWIPTSEVQAALRLAQDAKWKDETGALGGGELTVLAPFSVTPNPITGKGPNALLSRDSQNPAGVPIFGEQGESGYYWIAFGCDADCADFLRRLGVVAEFEARGELSEVYRRSIGLAAAK